MIVWKSGTAIACRTYFARALRATESRSIRAQGQPKRPMAGRCCCRPVYTLCSRDHSVMIESAQEFIARKKHELISKPSIAKDIGRQRRSDRAGVTRLRQPLAVEADPKTRAVIEAQLSRVSRAGAAGSSNSTSWRPMHIAARSISRARVHRASACGR